MRRLPRELFVERHAPVQDAINNVHGDLTGGEAGNFRLR
jgi:hypothetical protein